VVQFEYGLINGWQENYRELVNIDHPRASDLGIIFRSWRKNSAQDRYLPSVARPVVLLRERNVNWLLDNPAQRRIVTADW